GIRPALARAGAGVAMNFCNNAARAEIGFSELLATGGRCVLVRGNVTDPAEVRRIVSEVEQTLGKIDILVPNPTPDQPLRPIEEYDWDFYQSMIDFFVKS